MTPTSTSCTKQTRTTYFDRLRLYEAEKKRLWDECFTSAEYEQRVIELARKWRI